MRKQILLFMVLLAIAIPSLGHQALFVHDADGDRIGELIDDLGSEDMVLLTSDGHLLRIDMRTGKFYGYYLPGFYYESDDCTGQPFVTGDTKILIGGGYIILVQSTPYPELDPTFAKLEWFPEQYKLIMKSSMKAGVCRSENEGLKSYVRATPIEPPDYNIKQLDADTWGFKKPFSMVRETPDGIFCNGFESCPSQ